MYKHEYFNDGFHEHLEAFTPERRQELIAHAQEARDMYAVSYRNFLVGCSVLSVKNGETSYQVHSAGNYTPEKKIRREEGKWCAERVAINAALSEGGTFIPAMVSVCKDSDRGENEQNHGVLHPCPECRNLLRHLLDEKIMHEQTKICNVNDTDPLQMVISEMSVRELLDLYEKSDNGKPKA